MLGDQKVSPLVDVTLAAPHELVVLGAPLVGDRGRYSQHELLIPRRRQSDRLREDRRPAGARYAMQRASFHQL